MCNICNVIGTAVVNCLYALEKLSGCIAFTLLLGCLLSTMLVVAGVGIGLGYNYCTVELKSRKSNFNNSGITTTPRPPGDGLREQYEPPAPFYDKYIKRVIENIESQNATQELPLNASQYNLNPLMDLLKAKRNVKNYTHTREMEINVNNDDSSLLNLLNILKNEPVKNITLHISV